MIDRKTETLMQTWWPAANRRTIQTVLIMVLGSVLLAVSAKVKVPIEPVPVTMQVFVVLALGLGLGMRLATATVLLYLAEGAAGLPVFTGTPEKGLGLAYMMGPTGGYLLGYIFAAAVTGWFADRGFSRHTVPAIGAALAGMAIIYAAGLVWLGTLVGWDKPVLAWGFWPFIGSDLIKASLAGLTIAGAWALTTPRRS